MKKLIAVCLLATVQLSATLIDFETPPPGMVTNGDGFRFGTTVESGALLLDQYWTSLGVRFSTGGSNAAALVNLGSGHATSGTNGIGPVNGSGQLDYSLALHISFYLPGTLIATSYDNVTIRGDQYPVPEFGSVNFRAYDVNGILIASRSAGDVAGGTYGLFTSDGLRVHRLEIWSTHTPDPCCGYPGTGDFGTTAFDDVQFFDSTDPVIPEPSTWLLMAGGLAATGFLRRFRR